MRLPALFEFNPSAIETESLKFIHCADLHLDSPLRGLDRYDGAPADEIRGGVRRAMDRLLELAIDESVDFVLIAGDVYDGDSDNYDTAIYFSAWIQRFVDAKIPVYAITGNHDAESKITRNLRLPDNADGSKVMLSSRQTDTVTLDDLGVAIHGRGFADQEERENLVLDYPAPIGGLFNIGMLHTSLDGATGGTHKRYAPCSPQELIDRQYQYWALGHVHTRRRILGTGQSPIVFCGNVQWRHIRETGAKGCELVHVDDAGHVTLDFRPLDVFRFELCNVDVEDVTDADELITRFRAAMQPIVAESDGLPLGIRVIVGGRSTAHDDWLSETERWRYELRGNAFGLGTEVWVEKIKFETTPLRPLTAEDLGHGAIAELVACIEQIDEDPELAEELIASVAPLFAKFPDELHEELAEFVPRDTESLRATLSRVQPMLMKELQSGTEGDTEQ